jgi:hypothetical protein
MRRRAEQRSSVSPWIAATVENAIGGAAISVGILGITHGGRDVYFGLALIVAAMLLLLRGASLNRSDTAAGTQEVPSRLRLTGVGERVVQLGTTIVACLALVGVAFVLIDASKKPVLYASANDGLDPARTRCTGDARPIGDLRQIKDAAGAVIGALTLRQSDLCSTVWPKIVLTAKAAPKLAGRAMRITSRRPADNHVDNFTLQLHGGRYAWSNML